MKFMLMMHAPRAGWTERWESAPGRRRTSRRTSFMRTSTRSWTRPASSSAPRGWPPRAGADRARGQGRRPGGHRRPVSGGQGVPRRLLDRRCREPGAAYEIAARISPAPGKGGAPLNMPIEVRQVMSAPPVGRCDAASRELRRRAPAARPRAAGARRRRPPLRRLRRRRGRGAGGAARGGDAVAARRASRTTRAAG